MMRSMAEESEDHFLKKVMAAMCKASPNYEFIGVQQSVHMATFKARKGKKATKSFHYRVFTEDGSDGTKGHVEIYIKADDPRIVEFE